MPPRKRAASAPSEPTSPVAAHRTTTSLDVPSRVGAPSPAPNAEDATPESTEAQFELIQELTQELRENVAQLVEEGTKTSDARKPTVETCMKTLASVRTAQRRALMGLEYLKAGTRRRDKETDPARVRAATVAYETAWRESALKRHADAEGSCGGVSAGGIELMELKEYEADAKRRGLPTKKPRDEYELMTRRLAHELIVRREMVEEQNALKAELAALQQQVAEKKKLLGGSLEATMTNVRKSAEPLRRMFHLAYESAEDLDALIRLLPVPLHVLYAQLKHLQQNEEEIKVELVGRIDDAQNFKQKKASEEEGELVDEGAENNRRSKKRKARGGRQAASASSSLYEEHPLRVEVGFGATKVFFTYLTKLHVVVVSSKPEDEKFLGELFPDDDGSEMPNHAVAVVAPNFTFDASCAPSNAKPYKWAQNLAGLSFLPPFPAPIPDTIDAGKVSAKANAEEVVRAIREKLDAR